jgi:ribonuclease HI
VILAGARAVLPVFRTTPVSVLHRESGLLTPQIELDQVASLATTRLRRLDPCHPLRKRAGRIVRAGRPTSRIARRVLSLPKSEQINPLRYAPWPPQEARKDAQLRIGAPMGRSKEQAADDFAEFYHSLPGTDIKVFSDGSKLSNGQTGGGFAVFQAGHQFLHSSFPLGPNKDVFDAEAEAALAGLKAAISLETARFATNLWVILDNLEVALRLLSPSTGSSQRVFKTFCELASTWPLRERLPHTNRGSVQIRWVPGHTHIPENEVADHAAEEGAALNTPPMIEHSYASLKRQTKASAMSAIQLTGCLLLHSLTKILGLPPPRDIQTSLISPAASLGLSLRPAQDMEILQISRTLQSCRCLSLLPLWCKENTCSFLLLPNCQETDFSPCQASL